MPDTPLSGPGQVIQVRVELEGAIDWTGRNPVTVN